MTADIHVGRYWRHFYNAGERDRLTALVGGLYVFGFEGWFLQSCWMATVGLSILVVETKLARFGRSLRKALAADLDRIHPGPS